MDLDELLRQVHYKAKEHLFKCVEAMYAEEEGIEDVESPACAPFCGCDDCVVREVLMVAWNDLIAGAIMYIEDNARDQEAINQIYSRALKRIAAGEVQDPALLAKLTLGESNP